MDLPESPYYTERIHRSYRDRFTVVWMVTRTCNFRCAYCYQPESEGDPFEAVEGADIDKFIERLAKLPQPIRIQITGGEATQFPWIIEVCQRIGAMGGVVELQTNFSIRPREILDNTDPSYMEYHLVSYHPRERERVVEGGIPKLIDDLLYAREKGFYFIVWHIDDPRGTPEQFLADCKILYDAGITPVRKRYTGPEGGGQPGDAIELPKKVCRAGNAAVCLWENFDMSPCDHDRTVLGNLFTEWKFYEEPMPCDKPFCGCGGRELIVDKFYDSFFQKEFGG